AGIASQRQLGELVGERASNLLRIVVLHGHAKLGDRFSIARRVRTISAQQLNIDLVESRLAAKGVEPLVACNLGFGFNLEAGDYERHRVPVTADVVDRLPWRRVDRKSTRL